MLHAIAQGKSRIYRRYIGIKDEHDEKKVASEDEITALILGPLKYLESSERARFWHHLLTRCGASDHGLPADMPINADMILWKRFTSLDRKVEPDLMVYLKYPYGQRIPVIVELKWRSSLSGANQLHLQWEKCLDDGERKTSFHLFIGLETSAVAIALQSDYGDPWKGRLLAVDWASIKQMLLNDRIFETAEGREWSQNVCKALEKLGIRAFKGFSDLGASYIPVPYSPLFWKGLSGWNRLIYSDIPVIEAPVFFSR